MALTLASAATAAARTIEVDGTVPASIVFGYRFRLDDELLEVSGFGSAPLVEANATTTQVDRNVWRVRRGLDNAPVASHASGTEILGVSDAFVAGEDEDVPSPFTTGGSPGGSALAVSDEGTPLDAAVTSFDFTGAGVSASVVGHAVTVTVEGAAPHIAAVDPEASDTGYGQGSEWLNTTTDIVWRQMAADPENPEWTGDLTVNALTAGSITTGNFVADAILATETLTGASIIGQQPLTSASLALDGGQLVVTAQDPGVGGNAITFELAEAVPPNEPLAISVVGNDIVVTLPSDGLGDPVATLWSDIADFINNDVDAFALVEAVGSLLNSANHDEPQENLAGGFDESTFLTINDTVSEETRSGLTFQSMAGTADPSAGAGIAANIGSRYTRDNAGAGELWLKTGAADTDWTQLGSPTPMAWEPAHYIGDWAIGTTYAYGDAGRAFDTDTWKLYISRVAGNIGNDPVGDAVNWFDVVAEGRPVMAEGSVNPGTIGEQTRITHYTQDATGGTFDLGFVTIDWDAVEADIQAALDADLGYVAFVTGDAADFEVEYYEPDFLPMDLDDTNLTGGGLTLQADTQDQIYGGFAATSGSMFLSDELVQVTEHIGHLYIYNEVAAFWILASGETEVFLARAQGLGDAPLFVRGGSGAGSVFGGGTYQRQGSGDGNARADILVSREGSGEGDASIVHTAAIEDTAVGEASVGSLASHHTGGGVSILAVANAAGANIVTDGIPTADPVVTGALWSDGGTIVLSGSTAGGLPDLSGLSLIPDPTVASAEDVANAHNALLTALGVT